MRLYRHTLVWLLRVTGAASLVFAGVWALTALGIYDTYQQGQLTGEFLLDMMVPQVPALVIATPILLSLSEILALQIKRNASA